MISFNKEQIYIVTGASSGLGKATAILLNKLGATVIGIGRSVERLEQMKSMCQFPENVFLESKDLTEDIAGLPTYVKTLKEKYGKFSGMAYCAGIGKIVPLQILSYEHALEMVNTNYLAPLFFTKGVLDRRNNIGNGTSMVFLSSIDAKLSSKGQPMYSGTKAALSASIKSISKDVARYGIRLNCLLPSMIKTPMALSEECSKCGIVDSDKSETYPFGWGEPDDVANMIIYLLSDKAKFISGQNYIIDSGGVL